mmetsp:Transcript_74273/g.212912  ORF Transcript_74273/g.212912 Transcript_74273/m.212912 type:complete len:207 (-) Transcript_74273:9-629(-)
MKEESFATSEVAINEACTMMSRALTKLSAFLSCNMAAPPLLISRSMMPEAREIWSMVPISSFSSVWKSLASSSRILVALARSASFELTDATSSSTFCVFAEMVEASSSMVAFKASTSDSPVLIWKPSSRERSSQYSENSAYTFCEPSPSLMMLVCKSEIMLKTLPMGESPIARPEVADIVKANRTAMAALRCWSSGARGLGSLSVY